MASSSLLQQRHVLFSCLGLEPGFGHDPSNEVYDDQRWYLVLGSTGTFEGII